MTTSRYAAPVYGYKLQLDPEYPASKLLQAPIGVFEGYRFSFHESSYGECFILALDNYANNKNYRMEFDATNKKLVVCEEHYLHMFQTKRTYAGEENSLAATYTQCSNLFLSGEQHRTIYDEAGQKIDEKFYDSEDFLLTEEQVAEEFFPFCDENKIMKNLADILENHDYKNNQYDSKIIELKDQLVDCLRKNIDVPRVTPPAGSPLKY